MYIKNLLEENYIQKQICCQFNSFKICFGNLFYIILLKTVPIMMQFKILFFLLAIWHTTNCGCAYTVNSTYFPEKTMDPTPHNMSFQSVCAQFTNQLGCCNQYTDKVQRSSYGKIDVIFGNSNGGCDVCAVNLKRFWCEYACSPNQDQWIQVGDYITIPNPQKQGQYIKVQNITLWVEASTTCSLFQSCSRTSYAAQLSAMQTPAGFLTFQGQNAMDDGIQYINMKFTNDKTKGLYMKDLDPCGIDIDGDTLHGFPITGNCSCNSCSQKCSGDQFKYKQSPVFEGFNLKLVGYTWGGVIVLTGIITLIRYRRKGTQQQN